jgi:hypothetical protein
MLKERNGLKTETCHKCGARFELGKSGIYSNYEYVCDACAEITRDRNGYIVDLRDGRFLKITNKQRRLA